jgi:hypothetical protein
MLESNHRFLVLAIVTMASAASSTAVAECPPQEKLFDNTCVGRQMADFLICVSKTNGPISVTEYRGTDNASANKVGVTASAKVGIYGGGVNVQLDKQDFQGAVQSFKKEFPNLAQDCKAIVLGNPGPKLHSPTPHPSGPKPPSPSSQGPDANVSGLIQQGKDRQAKGESGLASFQDAFDVSKRRSAEAAGLLGLAQSRGQPPSDEAEYHLRFALDHLEDPWVVANRTSLEKALKGLPGCHRPCESTELQDCKDKLSASAKQLDDYRNQTTTQKRKIEDVQSSLLLKENQIKDSETQLVALRNMPHPNSLLASATAGTGALLLGACFWFIWEQRQVNAAFGRYQSQIDSGNPKMQALMQARSDLDASRSLRGAAEITAWISGGLFAISAASLAIDWAWFGKTPGPDAHSSSPSVKTMLPSVRIMAGPRSVACGLSF